MGDGDEGGDVSGEDSEVLLLEPKLGSNVPSAWSSIFIPRLVFPADPVLRTCLDLSASLAPALRSFKMTGLRYPLPEASARGGLYKVTVLFIGVMVALFEGIIMGSVNLPVVVTPGGVFFRFLRGGKVDHSSESLSEAYAVTG